MNMSDTVVMIISNATGARDRSTEQRGPDGILRCTICGGNRETVFSVGDRRFTVPCNCPCKEEAYIREREENKRREKLDRIARYRDMGFSDTVTEGYTFANDDRREPRLSDAMQRYVEHFDELRQNGTGLLLYGPSGSGKSFFAGAVANALTDLDHPCLMTSAARLANDYRDRLGELSSFSLVVLDDLGVERDTEFMNEKVYLIVDTLYRAKVPIIVTTNEDPKKMANEGTLEKRRFYDRLLERCHPVKVDGSSRRKQMGRESYAEMNSLLGLG